MVATHCDVWRDAIIAIIQQYNPVETVSHHPLVLYIAQENSHPIRIHALPSEELIVIKARYNLLNVSRRLRLEVLDLLVGRALRRERGLDTLHVALEIRYVGFLVEAGLLEAEGVDDVVDGLFLVFDAFLAFFSGGVGANVYG